MTPVAPYITSFLREHLPIERGYSLHTCDSYAYAFRLLFIFAADRLKKRPSQLCVEDITAKLVLDFLAHIEKSRSNSPVTRNARLAAIKAFMRYVELKMPEVIEQIHQIRAIPTKRHDQSLAKHLTLSQVKAILDAPNLNSRSGIRDRAMLHLCFACGLRVSELVELPLEAVSLRHPPSIRVTGKGRRERCLPLWKDTARDLRAWLAVRGPAATPELFVNGRGVAMSRSGFEYILEKHFRVASKIVPELKSHTISPHQLRHSCAVLMLQATRDIRKVALWLGHSDMRTTEAYLRANPSEKLEAMEAVLPPSLRRGRFKAPDALLSSLLNAP